jgi:flavin reductase (DIM6/NTAB) family NADH-FMN oxidoreductase RutF
MDKLRYIGRNDLAKMDKINRLNFVNSLSGYKSANLIGTKSIDGKSNLAIINSVIHLSSNPPLIGYIQRPPTVPRHSYNNIKETSSFTINHVHRDFAENAHYTSAKFENDESEFEQCGLTEEYLYDFPSPFVKESQLKIAVNFEEEYEIKSSNTILVVGLIDFICLPEDSIRENGQIDLNSMDTVCISGLNNYHEVKEIASYPFARPDEIPKHLRKT